MQGSSSKVIMGATLVMAVSLAIVVGLVFVLLAELYCSILLRRRRRKLQASATANADGSSPEPSAAQLSSFYSQGVLAAPRSLLFPASAKPQTEEQHPQQAVDFDLLVQESKTSPRQLGILSPPNSYVTTSPQPAHVQSTAAGVNAPPEHLVYISNPIYDGGSRGGTPFETPDTSPSRLESGGSSSDEENQITPPLSPMKKLPAEACSVSLALKDATSLGTSASDSNGHSSSSSGSPRTSPSW